MYSEKLTDCEIAPGTPGDIDEIAALYDALHEHFRCGFNYPGWLPAQYPVRETAERAIAAGSMFVLHTGGRIAGTVVLNNTLVGDYHKGKWSIEAAGDEIVAVHTLAVHPDFMRHGAAARLMDFAREYAVRQGAKTIRLDTPVRNKPAQAFYEKAGYTYVGTVELNIEYRHIIWFRLYELVL